MADDKRIDRADKGSAGDNKKYVYRVLATAIMAVMLTVAMVALKGTNVKMTVADTTQENILESGTDSPDCMKDIIDRGVAISVFSEGTLYKAYDNDEEQPDVDEDAVNTLLLSCMESFTLTSNVAAVQTASDETGANDDGTYSLTVPLNALMLNGAESVDRLALYAVVQASDGSGVKLVEVPYEVTLGLMSDNASIAKLSLPSAVTLLIIDKKSDADEESTTAGKTEQATKGTRQAAETQPTSFAGESNNSTTAKYDDVEAQIFDEPETKLSKKQKQTVTKPVEEQTTVQAETPTDVDDLAGVADESPVTGGHDF